MTIGRLTPAQIQKIFPQKLVNLINKLVLCTRLFIGLANLSGNTSCKEVLRADNCQKLTKSADEQSQSDIHNVKARVTFGENPLRFTKVIVLKLKYR